MKKILSLLLILALSTSLCLTPAWAEEEAVEAVPVITEDAQILADLGIIESPEVLDANKNLTRGEFAIVLANALGGVKEDAKQYFTDVPETHAAYKAVAVLAGEGIVHGGDNGAFLPDSEINFVDALKMVICALGYNDLAIARGGYTMGYISIGASLKLPKGSGVLKGGAAAELIVEVLETETAAVSGVSESGSLSYTGSGKTLMESRLDILEVKGQLIENYATALSGEASLESGYAIIGDELYLIEDSLAMEYIGFNVIAYVQDTQPHKTVKTLRINEAKTLVREVTANDIDEATTTRTSLAYYSGNSIEEYKISPYADVIYNGQALKTSYTKEDFCPTSGKVVLIDTDNDRVYDVVKVTSYENVFLGYSLTDTAEGFADKFDSELAYDIDPKTNIVMITDNETGAVLTVSDLLENTLLSVAQAKDMEYGERAINILVNRGTVNGKIARKGSDYIIIDGAKYSVSESYRGDALEIGKVGNFYLDFEGKIAVMEEAVDTDLSYGMIFGVAGNTDSFEEEISVKILTIGSEMVEFKLGDNFRINDEKVETAAQLRNILRPTRYLPYGYADINFEEDVKNNETGVGSSTAPNPDGIPDNIELMYRDDEIKQVVKFQKNEEGELIRLYTAIEGNENILSKDAPLDQRACKNDNASFGKLYLEFFYNQASFLLFPSATASYSERQEERQYTLQKGATGINLVTTGGFQAVEAYDINEGGYAGLILKEEAVGTLPEINSDSKLAVVDSIITVWDEDEDEEKSGLIVYMSGSESTLVLSDNANEVTKGIYNNLGAGDIIRYKTDRFGEMILIKHDLDLSETDFDDYIKPVLGGSRGGTYQQQMRVIFGAIVRIYKGSTMITTPDIDKVVSGDTDDMIVEYMMTNKLGRITIFNRKTGEARGGAVTDLSKYVYSINKNARVVYRTGMGMMNDCIIYE